MHRMTTARRDRVTPLGFRCGALDYTARLAQEHADRAVALLDALPASTYRDALEQLARFAVKRSF